MFTLGKERLGYLLVIIGVLLYSISDAVMKFYTQTYPVSEVVFLRTITRFFPFIILAFASHINPFRAHNVKVNVLRAILASAGTYLFIAAYSFSGMTDVFVVGSTSAFFVIPFSVWILKERFNVKNALAIALGFIGICLAFRPGIGIFQFGSLFALIASIISALNQVIIKKLAAIENELTIIFYHNTVLLLFSLCMVLGCFVPIRTVDAIILIAGGVIGSIAQYCMIHAFKLSTGSGLASAGYVMVIPNIMFDIFLFHHSPDVYIISGLIITLSGLLLAFSIQSQIKSNGKTNCKKYTI